AVVAARARVAVEVDSARRVGRDAAGAADVVDEGRDRVGPEDELADAAVAAVRDVEASCGVEGERARLAEPLRRRRRAVAEAGGRRSGDRRDQTGRAIELPNAIAVGDEEVPARTGDDVAGGVEQHLERGNALARQRA